MTWGATGYQFQTPFVFNNFVHSKRLGSKEKIKLNFLRLFGNPFSKYLIFKRISQVQWLFWVIQQNEKGIWGQLLVHIFCKNVPYIILYQGLKFQCHIFFLFQDIKQNVLLSFLGSTCKARADRKKERRKRKYTNLNISKTRRAFQMK